jgi:hypothetical protein
VGANQGDQSGRIVALLGDGHLGQLFLQKQPKFWAPFSMVKVLNLFGQNWVGLCTFWAMFSQTHLVTLTEIPLSPMWAAK